MYRDQPDTSTFVAIRSAYTTFIAENTDLISKNTHGTKAEIFVIFSYFLCVFVLLLWTTYVPVHELHEYQWV